MQESKLLVALLGALCAMPVLAEEATVTQHKEGIHVIPASAHTFTSNVGFVSNYIFRGIAQASTNPAIQGGMDYSHTSGFYAGLWGSNVSWIADSGAVATGSVTMELDTYLGYKSSITEDVGYDVGYVRYNYVGNYTPAGIYAKADTAEVYAALSYKFLSAKYSYSLGDFLTVPGAKGTNYIEMNANYTIPDTTFTLIGHVGKQTYVGSSPEFLLSTTSAANASYTDYKVGVAKDFNGYVVTVAYSKTDASTFYTYPNGGNWARGMTAVSLTHSF